MYKPKERIIRAKMVEKGLKHGDMAKLCHLTRTGWALFLKGEHKARIDTALIVAKALETPVEELFELL